MLLENHHNGGASSTTTASAFFTDCGILYPDHLAVTTSDLERTLHDYLSLPGSHLLRRIFPDLSEKDVCTAAIDRTLGWYPITQFRVVMEVEDEFGISIPANRIATVTDYAGLLRQVNELGSEL